MARHNDLISLGIVKDKPEIRYNRPEGDPDRKALMVSYKMIMIRGIRHFGAVDERMKLDAPIVLTTNTALIEEISTWNKGDIVLIKGTVASMDAKKRTTCPNCGKMETVSDSLTYINPILALKLYEGLESKESLEFLKSCAEISNRITILGDVYDTPELHTTRTNQRIVNYKLEATRKYRIKGDYDNHRKDYIIVKSYGKIADNDYQTLKPGDAVLIEGMLQVRQYTQNVICPYCKTEHQIIRSATEIIPYSTEYIGALAQKKTAEIQS